MNNVNKKTALAITAIFIAVMVMSLIFSIVIGTNIHTSEIFGYADTVFSNTTNTPLQLSGRDDLISIEYAGAYNRDYPGGYFTFRSNTNDRAYSLSTLEVGDGRIISGTNDTDCPIVVEKKGIISYEHVWKGTFNVVYSYELNGNNEPAILEANGESGEIKRPISFPIYQPGKYRITIYFRDLIKNGRNQYSTGNELYSVSFQLTIPDALGSKFDVLTVAPACYGLDNYLHTVGVTLRSNSDELPYINQNRMELYKLEDGVSREMHDFYEPHPIAFRRDFPFVDDSTGETITSVADYRVYLVNIPHGDYKLTLHFTENEDGSGEQYTLTLNLRFDE